jgi:hypothetical protein
MIAMLQRKRIVWRLRKEDAPTGIAARYPVETTDRIFHYLLSLCAGCLCPLP